MKTKITLLGLLAFLFFMSDAMAQCIDGYSYPFSSYQPTNSGSFETINNNAGTGQYVLLTYISTNRVYTFATSVPTDYITLTNINDEIIAHGPSGLTYTSPHGSNILYYIHSDANCGEDDNIRTRFIASQPLPSCGSPTALTVSNITSNSSRISWTAPATAPGSGYEVYASTTMLTPVASAPVTASTTTNAVEVLSGLNPATTYYYWVRSNCGAQKGLWWYGGHFTTNAVTGCNGAAYGLYPSTAFTPNCNGTAEQIATNSWAGQYSNINVLADKDYTFSSSVATDHITITNTAGTVIYASGTTPLTWSSSAVSGVVRYYIHSDANCGTQNTNRIKSITCATTSCGLPSNLAVSNITANSAKVTWDAPSVLPSSGYELYRNTTGTAPTAATAATQTAASNIINPMTVLVQNTTYYYWIRSVCGTNKSNWVAGGSFTTNPELGCNGAYNGMYPEATFTPVATGASETIVTDAKGGQYTNVNIVANKQYTFTSSTYGDYMTITNETGDYVYATGATPLYWTSNDFTGVVRYYLHSNAGCEAASVNRTRSITCAPISNCTWASGINVSAITSNSAMISWAPAEAGVTYYVYVGSSRYTAPNVGLTQTGGYRPNGFIVNQLQPNTQYYYFVRKTCAGGGFTPWISGGTFKTLAAIYISCNGASFGIFPLDTFTPAGTGELETITQNSSASQFSYMNIATDKQYLFESSFDTDYLTITNYEGTEVLAKGSSPMTWNSGPNTGIVRYYLHSQVACGSDSSTRGKYVTVTDNCVPPSVPTLSNFNAVSARYYWTGNASSFQYYCSTDSTIPATDHPTTENITTLKNATVSNLLPGTTYYFWIRSVCGDAATAWVAGGNFTTLAGGCTTGNLFPNNTIIPICTGGPQVITTQAYAGEYSVVNITPSTSYVFESSVATDYITITNLDATVAYAWGTTPLTWSSNTNTEPIKFYIHTDDNCGTQNVNRTRTITCVAPNTCGLPTNIAVTNITSNSATYSYTAPANAPTIGYQFQATLNNTAPLASVPAVANSSDTFGTMSGLAPNTTYFSWVRSLCFSGSGLWVPGPSFTTIANATVGCNGATNGVWPLEAFSPVCDGTTEVITNSAFAGQFSYVNIVANKSYTFTSSVATDYITLTSENGTSTLIAGASPLVWYSGTNSGVMRYHLNTNASCGASTTERVKSIACSIPVCDMLTNVSVSNVTSNAATFGWTGTSGNYQYYYTTQNVAPIGTTPIWHTSSNLHQLQGLSTGTVYYYWVRSLCNTGVTSEWTTGSFTTSIALSCNGTTLPSGTSPVYPATTFTPVGSGSPEQITNAAWPGEFSNIAIVPNKTYTFISAVATDYITITSTDGNTLHNSGTTPVVWSSGDFSGTVRFFIHTNNACGGSTTSRIKSVICAEPCSNPVTPTFAQVAPICVGGYLSPLFIDSTNGINGSWSPALNNTTTTTYTFTPDAGECAVPTTMTIVVNPANIVPTFEQVGPICPGTYINPLNVDSTNGIHGSWSPALNNMATTTYTFTPMPGQCAVPTTMTIATTLPPTIVPTFTQVAPICAGSFHDPLPNYSNEQIQGTWSPALNTSATTTYTFTPASGQCALPTTMTIAVTNATITPTFTQPAPICAGSFLAPLPVDSNNGIHGSWSPALNNMATTTYTFTPMPGQCAVPTTMTISVSANPYIIPTFTQVAPICPGTFLEALPVDSNNGINGAWSPALNSMITTTYTFTPYQGQCAVPTTMTIVVSASAGGTVPTFPQVPAICKGSYLEPLPIYSNQQIQGTWSPALNNMATTTYTFTPTAGQCAVPTTMTIVVNEMPAAPSDVTSCGAYTLPQLPNGYFYSGTNHEGTTLQAGTPIYYSQTVVYYYDMMPCSMQGVFEVTIQPTINEVVMNGGSITALMAGTGVTYQWYRCATPEAIAIPGATAQSYVPTENGSYQVKIEIPGCGSIYSDCVTVDDLSIDNNPLAKAVQLYPNPSHGNFTVETGTLTTEKITVIDNLGRIIKTITPSSFKTQIDIQGFADGIYMINIEYQGTSTVKKLILRQ